jgi:voltage-gated potassium channel
MLDTDRPRPTSLRQRVHFVLEVDRFGDPLSRFVDKALVLLIIANVVVAIVQTVEAYEAAAPWFFRWFEWISIVVFGLEYVLRVWSATETPTYAGHPVAGRLRFAATPMMLIDLAVLVVPFWMDLRPIRVLRLLRLGRYSPRLRLFGSVIHEKREELFVGLFIAVVLLVACSTAMYHVEGRQTEGHFESIPQTMWWGVATLTTVGYGDVYPVTDLGKALGSLVALLGVGVFALPAGILASGFSEALSADREARAAARRAAAARIEANAGERGTCPHCGSSL